MSKTNGAAAAESTTKRLASFREIADFLWQNAERMRGAYKPNEYYKVTRYLNDPQFQELAFLLLVKRIYDEIRGGKSEAASG